MLTVRLICPKPRGQGIFGRITFVFEIDVFDGGIDLLQRETGELDFEGIFVIQDDLKLLRQDLKVPSCIGSNLVVGNEEGSLLPLCELIEQQAGNFLQAKFASCFKPTVTGNDLLVLMDDEWGC